MISDKNSTEIILVNRRISKFIVEIATNNLTAANNPEKALHSILILSQDDFGRRSFLAKITRHHLKKNSDPKTALEVILFSPPDDFDRRNFLEKNYIAQSEQ
jgi:hypothetical protein